MTTDEQRLLEPLLRQLTAIKSVAKDPDAQRLIENAGQQQPDALYLLVQKALLQEQAIEGLRAQVASLEGQLSNARTTPGAAGFLDRNPWGAPTRQPAGVATNPGYSPFPSAAAPSPLGGFLGAAAATAAGVAGGAFLFHGIESLLHHPQATDFHGAGYQDGQGPESVTINHYHEGVDQGEAGTDEAWRVNDIDAWNGDDESEDGALDV